MDIKNLDYGWHIVSGNVEMIGSGISEGVGTGRRTTRESILVDGNVLKINDDRKFQHSTYLGDYFSPGEVSAFFVDENNQVLALTTGAGSVIIDEQQREWLKEPSPPRSLIARLIFFFLCITPLGFILVPAFLWDLLTSGKDKKQRSYFFNTVKPMLESF